MDHHGSHEHQKKWARCGCGTCLPVLRLCFNQFSTKLYIYNPIYCTYHIQSCSATPSFSYLSFWIVSHDHIQSVYIQFPVFPCLITCVYILCIYTSTIMISWKIQIFIKLEIHKPMYQSCMHVLWVRSGIGRYVLQMLYYSGRWPSAHSRAMFTVNQYA